MRHYPIIAEIDLDAFKHNINEFKKLAGPDRKLISVVKANAYGHGMARMAQAALEYGADMLAVARANEAMQLRKNDVFSPILLLGYAAEAEITKLIYNNITFTVYDYSVAEKISKFAQDLNKTAIIHIKIDTGMSRLGFVSRIKTIDIIKAISELPNLYIEGIYTHFADADNYDKKYTNMQLETFKEMLQLMEDNNINIPIKHAANSAGSIDCPEAYFDALRPGISQYGLYPSEFVNKNNINLKPVMKLKVEVSQVKIIPKGTKVGYGCRFTAEEDMRIATLPIGYADGFSRMLKTPHVLIKGKRAPVIGTICMDQCMVNINDIDGVKSGDEVIIIGRQGNNIITIEEVAAQLGTINYEFLCMIPYRIPRIYIESN